MKFRLTLTKLLIIIAIFAFLLGIFGPMGPATLIDPKPKLLPNEQNRINHPNGFSIIAPKGWTSVVKTEPNNIYSSIVIFPENKARFIPSLVAIKYKNSEQAHHLTNYSEYHKSKFLNFEAMIFEGRAVYYHRWHVIFSENEAWYGIELMLPHGKDGTRYEKVPDYWWPFLNSFRIDPVVVLKKKDEVGC
ncbi:MAG: hypothetical protein GWN67_03800 [Phycisphaerae bacterium]|nr:hypothetical protein [Phycisphaerae bacterium]NIP52464.1 hypothetical protein [Phycisphaerae bacterium]NIS50267.1 hypothetical protein [Phycisphaerae bacterium]NIU07867.1 hypothetical protein [Phycisphaerae bacterium]NIU55537.1 hypothetical protein [Phycisphaerae bacterium]